MPRTLTVFLAALCTSAPLVAQAHWAAAEPVGDGTPGSVGVPRVELSGLPAVDQPAPSLRITDGLPGALALLAVGPATVPTWLPRQQATLYPQPAASYAATLDDLGASASFLPQPAAVDPALAGLRLTMQAAVFDPAATGGLAFSAGLELTFGLGAPAATFYAGPQGLLDGVAVDLDAGDLDGDGRPDVVAAHADGTLTLLRAMPRGGLLAYATLEMGGSELQDVQLADLDGDGRLDVVAACNTSPVGLGRLGVRFGDGLGDFGPLTNLGTGSDCFGVRVVDLDGDGDLDLAAVRTWAVLAFLNDGGGGFGPIQASFLPSEEYAPVGFEVADVTADGVLDALVLMPGGGPLHVARGLGDGGFVPHDVLSAGASFPRSLGLGDVTGDGVVDALVGGQSTLGSTPGLALLEGLPGGGLLPPIGLPLPVQLEGITMVDKVAIEAVQLVDWDGDDAPDLLLERALDTSTGFHRDAVVLRGQPGGFQNVDPAQVVFADVATLADMDGDGRPDLVSSSQAGHTIAVRRGRGADGFSDPPVADIHGLVPLARAEGDLDGDGLLDLVVRALREPASPDEVQVLAGDGQGGFALVAALDVGFAASLLELVDVDGDGRLDLLASSLFAEDGLAVLLNQGAFAFAARHVVRMPPGMPGNIGPLLPGDFDGDGQLDLLVPAFDFADNPLLTLLGDGAGDFTVAHELPQGPWATTAVALGDFDADGVNDVALTRGAQPEFEWLRGLGDGSFADPVAVELPFRAVAVTAGDLDGGAYGDDLVFRTGPHVDAALMTVRSLGWGLFSAARLRTTGEGAHAVALADVNGDGALDALAGSQLGGCVTVHLGFGDGRLGAGLPFLAGPDRLFGGAQHMPPQFVDIEGDGWPDILTGWSSDLTLLRHRGP